MLILFSLLVSDAAAVSIDEARKAYDEAVYRQESGKAFLTKADKENIQNPLLRGYVGAIKMIMAKHYFNPLVKLSSYNQGKEMLEQAIAAGNNNAELVFLRFSIQCNSPRFLNYYQQIESDKAFLLANFPSVKDKALQTKIVTYLKSSSFLSDNEKQKLPAQL